MIVTSIGMVQREKDATTEKYVVTRDVPNEPRREGSAVAMGGNTYAAMKGAPTRL
jgi:hypothetical protein